MTTVKLELQHWEAKLLIEACRELERQWTGIVYTTQDEDQQADYGNDLAELKIVRDHVVKASSEAFGAEIATFSRESLP